MDISEIDLEDLARKVAKNLEKSVGSSIELCKENGYYSFENKLCKEDHWQWALNASNAEVSPQFFFLTIEDLLFALSSSNGLLNINDNPFYGKSLEEMAIMVDLYDE